MVTSSGGEEGTPVHEISSCDSPKPVHEGGEDREEEAATDDSVVEQPEEKETTSIWEVTDSPSENFQAQRHRTDLYDVDKATEGDCPKRCPSAEPTEAGTETPRRTSAESMRRRWQQASLARAAEPTDGSDHRC